MGHDSLYLKTEADLNLVRDPQLKEWVEAYAQDQNLFFDNYARAHVKVSEMGHEENLMSEMNESDIVNGGYQENQGRHWAEKFRENSDGEIVEQA